jgi:hypothetical protein
MTLRQLAEHLSANGFPTSHNRLVKETMPSRDTGPPREGKWGNCNLYDSEKGLDWARAKLKPLEKREEQPDAAPAPARRRRGRPRKLIHQHADHFASETQ